MVGRQYNPEERSFIMLRYTRLHGQRDFVEQIIAEFKVKLLETGEKIFCYVGCTSHTVKSLLSEPSLSEQRHYPNRPQKRMSLM